MYRIFSDCVNQLPDFSSIRCPTAGAREPFFTRGGQLVIQGLKSSFIM